MTQEDVLLGMHCDPIARRVFLNALFRAGAALAACGPASVGHLLAQTNASERLIVHSARPEDFETPPHLLGSWITPNDVFYVRSHFYTPDIQESAWRLRIDGDVERPLSLTLNELRQMRSTTRIVTLECAGNGRAFFQPPVAGVQWRKGAVGTARWTGVRLRDVLRHAGMKAGTRHVWLDGADIGIGRAPDFIRNVPVDKAMHPDTLLAYEMNGQTLPVAHGFPLRAVVPGWEGAYSVKWLTHIRVADREHDGAFVQSGYRYPRRPVMPGTAVAPADTVPLTGLVVKSLITAPAADAVVPLGRVWIAGVAWAGEDDIKQVDISTDHGRTWTPARLGRDRAPYAWRQFEYEWHVREPGAYLVLSRATDSRGRVQPIVAEWNPAGYLWNAVDRVRVNVGPQLGTSGGDAAAPPVIALPAHPGAAVVKTQCLTCHDMQLIEQQRLTTAGWTREVDKMIGWGANVSEPEKQALIEYLASVWNVR